MTDLEKKLQKHGLYLLILEGPGESKPYIILRYDPESKTFYTFDNQIYGSQTQEGFVINGKLLVNVHSLLIDLENNYLGTYWFYTGAWGLFAYSEMPLPWRVFDRTGKNSILRMKRPVGLPTFYRKPSVQVHRDGFVQYISQIREAIWHPTYDTLSGLYQVTLKDLPGYKVLAFDRSSMGWYDLAGNLVGFFTICYNKKIVRAEYITGPETPPVIA